MEQLRRFSEIGRQHYEKIVLSVALLLLALAAYLLMGEQGKQADNIDQIPQGFERKKVKEVKPIDLSAHQAILKRAASPAPLDFDGAHKLFNPVRWQQSSPNQPIIKVQTGSEVGPRAMKIVSVTPFHLGLTYERPASSTVGDKVELSGYWLYVTNEIATTAAERVRHRQIPLNFTNAQLEFILREAKGNPLEPTEIVGEFRDDGSKFSIGPGKPFLRVKGYLAELQFPNSTNRASRLRPGSSLEIDAQTYKVVDVTPTKVVVSDDSSSAEYSITNFLSR